ncbi:hypothetical protein V1520DRAFT_97619 [Lipomyces starkeyi]
MQDFAALWLSVAFGSCIWVAALLPYLVVACSEYAKRASVVSHTCHPLLCMYEAINIAITIVPSDSPDFSHSSRLFLFKCFILRFLVMFRAPHFWPQVNLCVIPVR